ncbi:MAG: hypothetical protein V1659_05415 [Candidatus Woesearchaeota archaeon]
MFALAIIIIIVIVALIVFSIIFSTVKWLVKLAFYTAVILFFALFIWGVLFMRDFNDFSRNFESSKNKVFLIENSEIIAGVGLDFTKENTSISFEEYLEEVNGQYRKEEFERIKGESYKIIFVDIETLKHMRLDDKIFEYGIVNLTKSEIINILESDSPFETAAEYISSKTQTDASTAEAELKKGFKTEESLKAFFFTPMTREILNPENVLNFVYELKNKRIIVYTETSMFRTVKSMPDFLINSLVSDRKFEKAEVLRTKIAGITTAVKDVARTFGGG